MKKSILLAPAGALAIGAAVLFLSRKFDQKKAAAPAKAAPPALKNLKTGSYSFASGYKDARTVTVQLGYDAEKFSYGVVSEDFLSDTGDSHVGILRGEDFSMQLEYAAYYGGEDFTAMAKHISERYKGFENIRCGGVEGIRYFDGKSLCMAFPAGTAADYLLIHALVPDDDADDVYLTLWDNKELQAIMNSLSISAA